VAETFDDGRCDIVGIGVAESRGIKRGVVVNLEAAVDSIKKAVEEAELMAGVEIDSVHLALSGPHVKGFNSRGVIAVAGKNREITRDDVRRALDAAKAVALPTGREILHVLPQDFVVDEQDGVGAPVGMTGARLEVNVHIVTGGSTATQNVVACVNRAGISVADTVIEQLAASEAVLTPDEKELGVAIVDIGGGTTDLAIFERGSLWHTGVVGIGGDHFTNDIAVGLRTPIPDAEKLKRKCGCALSSLVDEDETMEVASVGGRKPRLMAPRRGNLPPGVGRNSTRGLREIAELRHRPYGRWRDSRGHAGDCGADLRSAHQAWIAGWCRWSSRSRRESRVRDGGRSCVVRAEKSHGRSRPDGRRGRVRARGRSAAWVVQGILLRGGP
jgi:cell division protein FtsA